MKFMMLVKATKDSEAGLPPKPELMAAIGKLAEEAIKRGVMVDSGGLFPTSQSARIHLTGGKTSMIDGPFAETKELVGGYAIFNLKSKEEAKKLWRWEHVSCRFTPMFSGRPTKGNWRSVPCSTDLHKSLLVFKNQNQIYSGGSNAIKSLPFIQGAVRSSHEVLRKMP